MADDNDGGQPPLTATAGRELTPGVRFAPLTDLGEKIFLDRYALKDASKATLAAGDLVVVCTDTATGQREVGTVLTVTDDDVAVRLRDGTELTRSLDSVDKPLETSPEQMVARVARGIAAVEPGEQRAAWEQRFRWLLSDWRFVPGGRILTAAGTDQQLTFYNCYVVPSPRDSRHGIVDTLSQMMEIMSRGGGVGINISSLRPRHAYVRGVNGRSSGAVSWGALYSFVTGLIEQGGSRRGALMLICDVWHPDVMEFIGAKREMGKITNANISVGVTDAFMEAVRADGEWQLGFPDIDDPDYEEAWNGDLDAWKARGKRTIVHRTVRARQVWEALIESAWASAEPGLWFRDRANALSNSGYYAPLVCTNPCGEQPLPEWSVCNLGAINLGRFARDGGAGQEGVAWDELATAVRYAVRFLDDVVDATPYFFAENEDRQRRERRIGLGTMGLAELLIRLGLRYGSEESLSFLDRLYRTIAVEAYHATAELAAEKGSFPAFEADGYLGSGFMRGMPEEVRAAIRTCGARNVTLLTQAPTGTTGTMVDTSTGIEPYFSWSFFRKGRLGIHEERAAVAADWERDHPGQPLPDHFVTAMDLTPEQHVRVMATIQRWVDSSISKTCNVPADYTVQQTRELYELMYELGCKGGTIYPRPLARRAGPQPGEPGGRCGGRGARIHRRRRRPGAAAAAEAIRRHRQQPHPGRHRARHHERRRGRQPAGGVRRDRPRRQRAEGDGGGDGTPDVRAAAHGLRALPQGARGADRRPVARHRRLPVDRLRHPQGALTARRGGAGAGRALQGYGCRGSGRRGRRRTARSRPSAGRRPLPGVRRGDPRARGRLPDLQQLRPLRVLTRC